MTAPSAAGGKPRPEDAVGRALSEVSRVIDIVMPRRDAAVAYEPTGCRDLGMECSLRGHSCHWVRAGNVDASGNVTAECGCCGREKP